MPERNVIQNAEIIRRLSKYLGIRQAHVMPDVNEGLQPVVVVGDCSDRRVGFGDGDPLPYGIQAPGIVFGAGLGGLVLFNNVQQDNRSNVVLVLHTIDIASVIGGMAFDVGIIRGKPAGAATESTGAVLNRHAPTYTKIPELFLTSEQPNSTLLTYATGLTAPIATFLVGDESANTSVHLRFTSDMFGEIGGMPLPPGWGYQLKQRATSVGATIDTSVFTFTEQPYRD